MPDERTYGFSLQDATELANSIGSGEGSYPEIKPRGGFASLFGFCVNGPFASGVASAKIYQLDGADFGDLIGTHSLYDPVRWASGFLAGDIGLCQKSGGKYYAIQAPCPDNESGSCPGDEGSSSE
jgi:hypothetical protein